MSLSDLYQDIILDHYKNPRKYGEIEEPHVHAEDNNPSCGDDIELDILLDEDQETIEQIRFGGQGCAISMASGSLMADRIEGMSLSEVRDLRERFTEMVTNYEEDVEPDEELGDMVSLRGVIKFPVRVKCASLAWDTLTKGLEALEEQGAPARAVPNE